MNQNNMELDPKLLARLDDRQLAELIGQIASAVGADRQKASALMGNLDALRASLAQLTPEQAKALLDRAGEDKSRDIYDIIRRKG